MKPKFKNHFNRSEFPKRYEVNNMPSKTIPDQTMTVREIMERYAKGLPIDGARVPVYHGEDDDMPDISKLDLAEIQELKEAAQEHTDSIKQKLFTKQRASEKKPLKQSELDLPDNDSQSDDQPVKGKKQAPKVKGADDSTNHP